MSWRCCMETKPLCHSCMLTRVGKWHMGITVSFSHGHLRQAVPGHHQSNRYSSLGQSAWFSHLGTTVPSNSVHCCNLKKKKKKNRREVQLLAQCWEAWQRRMGVGEPQRNINLWLSGRAKPYAFRFISYYTALC